MQNTLTHIFSNNEEKIEYINNQIANLEKRISVQKETIDGYQSMIAKITDLTSENLGKLGRYASAIKDASENMAKTANLIAKLRNEIQAI